MVEVVYRLSAPKEPSQRNQNEPRGLVFRAWLGTRSIGFAICREGFKPEPNTSGYEPDVFDIDYIEVDEDYRAQGIGTGLTACILGAAKEAGSRYARFVVDHAGMVRLIEKLHQRGVIDAPIYAQVSREPRPGYRLPTDEILSSERVLGPVAVIASMNSLPQVDSIECVVPLTRQST